MFAAACLFLATYSLTIILTSVGYHRGLTHGGVRLRPVFRRLLLVWGNWLTGIDPQVWVVMHRLHHAHSDQPEDPHSPLHVGVLGIPRQQIKSYVQVFRGLRRQEPFYTSIAPDVALSWPTASGLWFLPYLLHIAIAVGLGVATSSWLLGAAYWLGMMSHGTQGVLINAFGHAWGGRNFDTPDNSRNNHLAAWLVLGEGYQNNHHRHPASARFSYRWWEVDAGYAVCRVLQALGVLDIERGTLIPAATDLPEPKTVLPWMLRSPVTFAGFRLLVYGTVGLASEVFFYNLTRWGRLTPLLEWAFRFDWRVDPRLELHGVWTAPQVALFGQASLWMFWVYGLCSLFLIEPLYRRLKHTPVLVRGFAYALAILGYEWCAGWVLRELTGMSIWIYADPWALSGTTSLALLPVWIGAGLFAEMLYRSMAVLAPLVVEASASQAVPAGPRRFGDAAETATRPLQ